MSINFNYFCHQTNKTNASIVCTMLRPALLFPLALDIYAQTKFIVIDIFAVPKCAFRALTHTCAKWQTAKDERRKKKNINPNYNLCSKKLRTSEKGKVIRGGAKKSSFCLFSCPQWYSLIRSFLDLSEDCATVSFNFFFFCKMKATPTKTRAKKKKNVFGFKRRTQLSILLFVAALTHSSQSIIQRISVSISSTFPFAKKRCVGQCVRPARIFANNNLASSRLI